MNGERLEDLTEEEHWESEPELVLDMDTLEAVDVIYNRVCRGVITHTCTRQIETAQMQAEKAKVVVEHIQQQPTENAKQEAQVAMPTAQQQQYKHATQLATDMM